MTDTAHRIHVLARLRQAEHALATDALDVLAAMAEELAPTTEHDHDVSVRFDYACLRCLVLRASEVVADRERTASLTPRGDA